MADVVKLKTLAERDREAQGDFPGLTWHGGPAPSDDPRLRAAVRKRLVVFLWDGFYWLVLFTILGNLLEASL